MRLARWTAIPLALMLLLAVVVPGAALAKTKAPFSAVGTVETIDEGTVVPVPGTDLFKVTDRTVTGTFNGPDLTGPYSFTYDALVNIAQTGRLKGQLTVGMDRAKVKGQSRLVAGPYIGMPAPETFVGAAAVGVDGKYEFSKDRLGKGSVSAVVWVMLNAEGHIIGILPPGSLLLDPTTLAPVGMSGASEVVLTGTAKQKDHDDHDDHDDD